VKRRVIFWIGFVLFAIFAGGLTVSPLLVGCARKSGEPVEFTGKVLSAAEVSGLCGKTQYAEVNSAWLAWVYADFRAELSAGQYGVQTWDNRAECTFFATSFEVFAQKRYFAQAWHASIPAPGIAVGTVWYHPTATTGHAVNIVYTESGPRYFEQQTGATITLTPGQLASVYFRKFD
jgi:carbohydrate-selective porin OprB